MEEAGLYTAYTNDTGATVIDAPAKSNGQAVERTIELKVTRERLQVIEVGEYLEYEDNPISTRARVNFLSNFVADGEGGYLDKKDAIIIIKKLTFPQLNQAMIEVGKLIKEAAVPNP